MCWTREGVSHEQCSGLWGRGSKAYTVGMTVDVRVVLGKLNEFEQYSLAKAKDSVKHL